MAEKDYNQWLAEAKASLDRYSAEQEAIAKLYEKAKQNAAASYESQQKQIAAQNVQNKNQAAAETKKAERNIGQMLASRGLAFSGENAQTHLDLNLSLQNRLAALDRDADGQMQELEQQKADTLTELDLAYANARSDSAKKRAEMQSKLAEIASDKEKTESIDQPQEDKQPDTDKTAPTVRPPDLKGKTLSERIRLMLAYVAQVKKEQEEQDTSKPFVPTVSARELAKQLVTSAGANGTVSGYDQQHALATLLDALIKDYDLDETYREELLLNLRSMGYRPDYTSTVDREVKEVCKQSGAVYTDYYDRYYKMYDMIGHEPADCDRMAGELAMFRQLVYIYERCESIDRFETAVESIGMEDELAEFYQKVKISDGKYKLGREIDRG